MGAAKSSASIAWARTARFASFRKRRLQRAGETPYFSEAIRLAPDGIYVSPIDLNRENNVTEMPRVPTMRIAAPVFAPDGKPFGIVMINIDMRPVLDRVRSSVRPGENVYVVNERGDYLVHPDPAREFGSQFGTPTDWRSDFPYLAASLGAPQGVAQIAPIKPDNRAGVALAPAVLAGSEWVGVIETVPNAVFMAPAAAIQHTSLLVGFIAVLCAAALAVFVASSLTRPISQLTAAVEGIGNAGPVAIPARCGRRDRRAGAGVCAGDGRGERQDRRAGARGPGTSPHRGGARPPRGARAPVQRRG